MEECIPLVADMLEKNHGSPGLCYVDRFDKTLPWLLPTNNVSAARTHIDQVLARRSRLELNTIGSD